MNHPPTTLTGLDGSNPLHFLAALGVLRVLDDHRPEPSIHPRLSWKEDGRWRPVIHDGGDLNQIAEAIVADIPTWDGGITDFVHGKIEKTRPLAVRGVRPQIAVFRAWLKAKRDAGDCRSLRHAACLMCETATTEPLKEESRPSPEQLAEKGIPFDDSGLLDRAVMPTFFDFTSRTARFLEQISSIRDAVTDPLVVVSELARGVSGTSFPRTMEWDPAADAPAAMYPGTERQFHPAVEWLAFIGLSFLPVFGKGQKVLTTSCEGRQKGGTFAWPIWDGALTTRTIESLLAFLEPTKIDQRKLGKLRSALGVRVRVYAALTKQADDKTGMFSPSSVG